MAVVSAPLIEAQMYSTIKSLIEKAIGGTFYQNGMRPTDATTEDAVLTVYDADAEQFEDGRARLNIYIRNVNNGGGNLVPNKPRIIELSELGNQVVDLLNEQKPNTSHSLLLAPIAEPVVGREEHVVKIFIKFSLATFLSNNNYG